MNFINAIGPAGWAVLLSDSQTPMKALATYVLREDDYITNRGHHPMLVQSLISTKYKTPFFFICPVQFCNKIKKFSRNNSMTGSSPKCHEWPRWHGNFALLWGPNVRHRTHYSPPLPPVKPVHILPLHFTKPKFNILSPTPASFELPLSCLQLFRSQHACTIDACRSLCCELQ